MLPEQLQNLIDLALADGEITEKERAVIIKKGMKLGYDLDELEVILDGHLDKISEKLKSKKPSKCPSCGEIISGISYVCKSCGYVISENRETKVVEDIRILEEVIIEIKSYPKPSILKGIKTVIFTYFTFGLYLLFRKAFDKNKETFEALIAKAQKTKREMTSKYGDDKKINDLLNEIESEIDKLSNQMKKIKLKRNLIAPTPFIALFIWMIFNSVDTMSSFEQLQVIENEVNILIANGKHEEALTKLSGAELDDFYKSDLFDKIYKSFIDVSIYENKFDSAKMYYNLLRIKDVKIYDDILKNEIYFLIDKGDVIKAERLINEIENIDIKSQLEGILDDQ